MNGLVSVIIPCYNQGDFLGNALQSLINQTYSNWECIIVDDGSADNTPEVGKIFQNGDSRITYFKKENGGLSSARNLGLNKIKGDFVQFLDADDFISVKKFELSIKSLVEMQVDMVISNFQYYKSSLDKFVSPYFKLNEKVLDTSSIINKWDLEFTIPIHCGFFKSEVFRNFRFPIELRAKEDWIMWVDLFKKENTFYFIDLSLAFYTIHDANMTKNSAFMFAMRKNAILYLNQSLGEQECAVLNKNELIKVFDLYESNLRHQENIKSSLGYKIVQTLKSSFLLNIYSFFKKKC